MKTFKNIFWLAWIGIAFLLFCSESENFVGNIAGGAMLLVAYTADVFSAYADDKKNDNE